MNEYLFLTSLISLLLIGILVFWLYRDYRIDKFRQNMFKLRDDFFDDSSKQGISFDSSAYGMMRSTMNGFIRFAHRMNFLEALLFVFMFRKKESQHIGDLFYERLEENKKSLNESQKKLIDTYHMKMHIYMIEHLILSSPLLLLTVIIPIAFIFVIKVHVSSFIKVFRLPLDKLDSAAFSTGQIS